MEPSSVALFRILYQNETLFQLEDRAPVEIAVAPPAIREEPPVPVASSVQAPASALPSTPAIRIPASAPVAAPAPPVTPPFPALKHKVLVLIDEPKQQEMIMSEALFLDNILKAVGHSIETSDTLNFSFLPGQDARTVLSGRKTNFFISFGVPLIKLHLDLLLAPYTPKAIEGIWFLLVDPLVVIEADRNLKKKLWQALQQMFEMS
nr:hypothetical protein [uncultured Dyadobacter sp.]